MLCAFLELIRALLVDLYAKNLCCTLKKLFVCKAIVSFTYKSFNLEELSNLTASGLQHRQQRLVMYAQHVTTKTVVAGRA